MNTILKRIVALVLCLVMVAGYMPVNAIATENGETVAAEATEVTTEPTQAASEETEAPTESTVTTEPQVIAVTGITLDQSALEVGVGAESVTLTATVLPENATDKTITWTSSEPGVASVDENGVVTFGYMGEATITAIAGEFSATCAVTVGEGEIADYATGSVIDAAIFCSDIHGQAAEVTPVFQKIAATDSSFKPSTASFVGDTDTSTSTVTTNAQSVFSGMECIYAYGSHDSGYVTDFTGVSYGANNDKNYYIYTISQSSMESSSPSTSGFTSAVEKMDKTKPLFILSHMPLHARRGDNKGASTWYTAISAAAEKMDIVFFWAHNHTGESSVDTNAYYVAKDGNETMSIQGGSTVTPNFTYMNAGYINANGQNPARKPVATTVKIYEDALVFQDYDDNGTFTGTYSHNVEVAREFKNSTDTGSGDSGDSGETEPATLSSIAVTTPPTKTTYSVGDTFSTDGMVVTATYSDDTTAAVTTYDVTAPDMTTAGTKTVTVTYGEGNVVQTTTFEITVNATEGGDSGNTGDNTEPDEESSNEVTLGNSGVDKEVYVLVDTMTVGKDYLIANGNSGSVTLLGQSSGSKTTTTAEVKTSGDYTYIETADAGYIWNATAHPNSSYSSYPRLINAKTYAMYASSGSLAFSNSLTSTSGAVYTRYWTYTDGVMACVSTNSSSTTYYMNSSFALSSSSATGIYIYEKQTINTGSEVTYTMRAENLKQVVSDTNKTGKIDFCLQGNGTDLTTLPSGGSYSFTELSDASGIIDSIGSDGTVTFTGTTGTATVKVAYTWTQDGQTYTVYKNITVEAAEPSYTLDITKGGNVVTGTTITEKGVTASTTLQLGTKIQYVDEDGAETIELPEGATIVWHIPEEYHNIATVDHETGLVTFKGVDGAFYVTATLTVGGKDYTVGVNISATTSNYSVPSDGVSDFPEYPNEGAIRFDKTATAVGNFSQTGIAQLELSMTGVPYTTGSEIDVVLMLDMTGSMTTDSMAAAEAAALAFARQIILNEDESYNNNRISVQVFNKSGVTELWAMSAVTADTYDNLVAAIESASTKQSSGGTPYSTALSGCKDILDAARTDGTGNKRQQFCVFVSDGTPTSYTDVDGGSDTTKKEKYSSLMQADGVTVYGVYTSAAAGSTSSGGDGNSGGGSVNDTEEGTAIMQNVASSDDKVYVVEDYTDTSALTGVFTSIAQEILQAATDVTVEDKITDEYTMIFDIPTGDKTITGVDNDFYIEFGKYALDDNHERTTFTSVTKLYLSKNNGVLSAKDAAAPVFEQKTIGDKGTLYYWSTNAADGDSGVSVEVDGTTYYFVSYGMKEAGYNMTSGAYAHGTVVSTTNMSNDLVIATPYFVYNAATKMIYWTVDKLDTQEYVLRYFLYLNNSATEVGVTGKETAPGSYLTNDHAYITYTNFKGNECRQEFPKPQLTWNGAQVSYVFYLVNAAGQPINKSGQVVDFANASFVTDVFTTAVVWNKEGDTSTGTGSLSADWLAHELLPDEYEIYDEQARYVLNVYENANGTTIKNEFTISGGTAAEISASLNERLKLETTTASVSTTKVYNTKAGEKISAYGKYTSTTENMEDFDFANTTVAFAVVWQPRLVPDTVVVDYGLDVLINVVENDILQNTVSGIGLGNAAYGSLAMNTGVSETSKLGTAELKLNGNTISIENENEVRFHQGDMQFQAPVVFYYETPVEFWEGSDPTEGFMYSSVTVIPATTIYYEDEFVDLNTFRKTFTEVAADAEFNADATYYIESNETFVKQTNLTEFAEGVKYYTASADYSKISGWDTDSVKATATQAQDRPGKSQISAALDADNNYGYDAAYKNMSQYSLGSAAVTNVYEGKYATAEFEFYGTGFDIISLTDTTTGVITINVYKDGAVEPEVSETVDNYYGYARQYWNETYTYQNGKWVKTAEEKVDEPGAVVSAPEDPEATPTYTTCVTRWVATTSNDPNALYQVPVMKIGDGKTTKVLEYGKYKAVITATYIPFLDHNKDDAGYNFYLDAIRIYNPAGDGVNNNDTTAKDAYLADGEYKPSYFEVRDQIISKETFDSLNDNAISGIVFIDGQIASPSVSDYVSYGPNNETYLAKNQAVAFELNGTYTVPSGYELAKIQLAVKTVGGEGKVEVYGVKNGTTKPCLSENISTATDMYYDITALEGMTVVVKSLGNAIISITNAKVTYAPAETVVVEAVIEENVTDGSQLFSVRRTTADAAIATMYVEEEVPETTVPETTEPEETKPAEPDNSELKAAVEKAKKLKSKGYTKESFKKLQTAIKTAEKVLKNRKATQDKIDKALADLNKAMESLKAKPDASALKKAVEAAKKLKEKDYTKESFKTLVSARKAAEKVLKDKKATQAQINETLSELNEAMGALIKKTSGAKPGKKR